MKLDISLNEDQLIFLGACLLSNDNATSEGAVNSAIYLWSEVLRIKQLNTPEIQEKLKRYLEDHAPGVTEQERP